MLDWFLVGLFGLVGGIVRVGVGYRAVLPHREQDNNDVRDEPAIRFGFLSTLLAGVAAGYAIWFLTSGVLFPRDGFNAGMGFAVFLAGVGGTDVLFKVVNDKYGTQISASEKDLNEEMVGLGGAQARSIETLSNDLAKCHKQNEELRRQVEELKKGGTQDK